MIRLGDGSRRDTVSLGEIGSIERRSTNIVESTGALFHHLRGFAATSFVKLFVD